MVVVASLLEEIECFLLDLDGTLYIGDRLIDGALKFLEKIKQSKKTYKFLTNNSSKSVNEYCEKLRKLKIAANPEDIITTNLVAIDYLKSNFPGKKVYLAATGGVESEYKNAGINIVRDFAEVVVLTYDTSLTYEKLAKAVSLINKGAFFIATHHDINCPGIDGYLPDLGSFLECIYASTNKRPDVICGKPNSLTGKYIEKICKLEPDKIAMVGDRLYTDMQFAKNCGFKSILVLSGETKQYMVEEEYDIVIESVKDLMPML